MLALATPMALTLMLALEMALAMALMPTRAVVAQARLCRRRLRVAGAGVDAGADAGAYAGGNAGTDACADAGASTDAGGTGTGADAGADTGDALMLALAQPLMPALALMLALMLARTLVIMAGASTLECGDEPNFLQFDEARCAQARQKRVQWILIPTIKKIPNLCIYPVFKYVLHTGLSFPSRKKIQTKIQNSRVVLPDLLEYRTLNLLTAFSVSVISSSSTFLVSL